MEIIYTLVRHPYIAVIICLFVYLFGIAHSGFSSKSLGSFFGHISIFSLVIDGLLFLVGFIGLVLFYPDSPQGPLIGFAITGPFGVLFGLMLGATIWLLRHLPPNKWFKSPATRAGTPRKRAAP